MIFKPYYAFETGCASYLFGCGGLGKCAVVDPLASLVDQYIAFAASKQMAITHVIETHVHADHASGGRALAERTGAAYCLHRSADVDFTFSPLDDGGDIELGNTRVKVLHTPGHTPESICLVVSDLRRGPEPWFVLTGDTLFVGAVGRPDLPGKTEESARALFASIHEKLLTLPDELEVYPAHFAGSVCGLGMSGKPSSTIAFEKRNSALLGQDVEAFVTGASDVPEKPKDMQRLLKINRGRAT